MSTDVDGASRLPVPFRRVTNWNGAATTFHPISIPKWYLTSWSMLADFHRADAGMADMDEWDPDHGHGHKATQAAHFDRLVEEAFEIDRPHGTPRLNWFLLAEKFRRFVAPPIRPHLAGASALTVCGGSGPAS